MEFEGSCNTVGLVVLRGLSLSASTRENQSSFGLSLTSGCTYRYCPHKSERWKHGSTNFQN
ncbi:hypothetical protein NC652_019314 [Populus alba x Populus x berolinensis]|uniref:Uncharacterized protein n=1 Tax=Populus alba x Populus x berolinensis TaxID=444605 RepID=A0AAD6QI72_9ROSI|nr:hypothetical protein NC652_019314 [Populus alba x Populus x berolinensis]KAJ6990804.1 hypothetical protein NC653_019151 [Populus alba x Populus x berolinensis]